MKDERTRKDEPFEIDLERLLMACLHRWRRVLVCGVLLAVLMWLCAAVVIPPAYEAGVTFYVQNVSSGQTVETLSDGSLVASRRLVRTYIGLVQSDRVLDQVSARSGYETALLRERLWAEQLDDTEIFRVDIRHREPEEAVRIANLLAEVVPGELEGLIEGSSVKVVDLAKLPEEPVFPNQMLFALVGGVLGCLLAAGWIILRCLTDRRIRDEEDLRAVTGSPVLARIPLCAAGKEMARQKAIQMLHINLMASLPERVGCVLAVTAADPGAEIGEITAELTAAFSAAGERVVLVDCAACGYAETVPAAKVTALHGEEEVTDMPCVQEGTRGIPEVRFSGSDSRCRQLPRLLEQLRQDYDYVIVAAPSAATAETTALAAQSDGVLLAVRAGKTERKELLQTMDQLEFVGGKILGTVWTGAE